MNGTDLVSYIRKNDALSRPQPTYVRTECLYGCKDSLPQVVSREIAKLCQKWRLLDWINLHLPFDRSSRKEVSATVLPRASLIASYLCRQYWQRSLQAQARGIYMFFFICPLAQSGCPAGQSNRQASHKICPTDYLSNPSKLDVQLHPHVFRPGLATLFCQSRAPEYSEAVDIFQSEQQQGQVQDASDAAGVVISCAYPKDPLFRCGRMAGVVCLKEQRLGNCKLPISDFFYMSSHS